MRLGADERAPVGIGSARLFLAGIAGLAFSGDDRSGRRLMRALQPRWLLVATLGAVGAGIVAAVWLYQAVGG